MRIFCRVTAVFVFPPCVKNLKVENLSADKDVLHLYTPYVDAAGHVVGKNIETVTLPFGFKEKNE